MFSQRKPKRDLEIAQDMLDNAIEVIYNCILWERELTPEDLETMKSIEYTLTEAQSVTAKLKYCAEQRMKLSEKKHLKVAS